MSPEQQQINELKQKVSELEVFVRSLTNGAQIPPPVANAITKVLSSASTKTAASATRAVDEAGAGTYNVMYPPTGFIKIGGYNVPYIT